MKKVILGALGMLVLLVFTGVVVFWFWVHHYLASAEFQAVVERQLGQTLNAECTLMPLRWTGFSVYSDGFEAKGSSQSAFQSLRANQVRAELSFRGLLEGRWEIGLIEAQDADVDFDPTTSRPELPPPAPSANSKAPGVLSGLLPREVVVQQVLIKQMNMHWLRPGATPVEVTGVTLGLHPEGTSWKIDAADGTLKTGMGPSLELVKASLRFRWPELFISEAELRPEGQGALKLSGEAAFAPNSHMDLHVELVDLPLEDYLPEDWRARLTGKLEGQIDLSGEPDQLKSLKATGTLEAKEGRLEALPALDRLATLTKVQEFRSLRLHQATADVTWTPGVFEFHHIVVESEAVVRIEGDIVEMGPQLNGKLEVGSTPEVLRAIPGAQSKVFTLSRDGYIWAQPSVLVTGTLDAPVEDLSPRLAAAAVNAVKDDVVNALQNLWDKAKTALPATP